MNKRGTSAVVQVLLLLIMVVVTSAIILTLVQTGLLTVRASSDEQILNAEFIPLGREGYLAIKGFQFCRSVSQQYKCIDEQERFTFGEEVHFRFLVESSTYQSQVMLIENYRLKDPLGRVILDVDEKNNFNVDLASQKDAEVVAFKDYFAIYPGSPPGEYTLDLVMENPLLAKTAKVTKVFMLE